MSYTNMMEKKGSCAKYPFLLFPIHIYVSLFWKMRESCSKNKILHSAGGFSVEIQSVN